MSSAELLEQFLQQASHEERAITGHTLNFKTVELKTFLKVIGYRVIETKYGNKCVVTLENYDNGKVTERWCFPRLEKLFMNDHGVLFPADVAPYMICFLDRFPNQYDFYSHNKSQWEDFEKKIQEKENVPPFEKKENVPPSVPSGSGFGIGLGAKVVLPAKAYEKVVSNLEDITRISQVVTSGRSKRPGVDSDVSTPLKKKR